MALDDVNQLLSDGTKLSNEMTNALRQLGREIDSGITKELTKAESQGKKTADSMKRLEKTLKQSASQGAQAMTGLETSVGQVNSAIEAMVGWIPFGIGQAMSSALKFLHGIQKQSLQARYDITQLNNAFGGLADNLGGNVYASYTKLRTASLQLGQSFAQSGQQISQMGSFMTDADIGINKNFEGFKAFRRMASGTGMDISNMSQIVEQSYRRMGLSIDDAYEQVADFHELAGQFGVNINKVAQDIHAAASGMELMGIKGRDITPIYKAFLETLGKGKEHLTGDLTRSFTQGLGKMSESYKAFFGVMGSGGGDALGEMFKFEQMLEESDIRGLGAMIGDSLVDVTGTGLLNKNEAIQNGLTQQFYMQRKMIEQSFGVGFKEAEEVMKVLDMAQKGEISGVDAKTQIDKLQASGQQLLTQRMTGLEKAVGNASIAMENMGQKVSSIMSSSMNTFKESWNNGEGLMVSLTKSWNSIKPHFQGVFDGFLKKLELMLESFLNKAFPSRNIGTKAKTAYKGFNDAMFKYAANPLLGGGLEDATQRAMEEESQRVMANRPVQHAGSPSLLYQMPRLNVGEGMSIVKRDEKVVTPQQAQSIRQSTASPSQPVSVHVETVCRECLQKQVEDGVHTIIRRSLYSE